MVTIKVPKARISLEEIYSKLEEDWHHESDLLYGYTSIPITSVVDVVDFCPYKVVVKSGLGEQAIVKKLQTVTGQEELQTNYNKSVGNKLQSGIGREGLEVQVAKVIGRDEAEKKLASVSGRRQVQTIMAQNFRAKLHTPEGQEEIKKVLQKGAGNKIAYERRVGTETEVRLNNGLVAHDTKAVEAGEVSIKSTTFKELAKRVPEISMLDAPRSDVRLACQYKGVTFRGEADSIRFYKGVPVDIVERKPWSAKSKTFHQHQILLYGYMIYQMYGIKNLPIMIETQHELWSDFYPTRTSLKVSKFMLDRSLDIFQGRIVPVKPSFRNKSKCMIGSSFQCEFVSFCWSNGI